MPLFRERKISPKFFRPKFFHGRPRGMSVPKCLFFQDLEGLTEVFGRMSAGISGQKLPLWAEFSFLIIVENPNILGNFLLFVGQDQLGENYLTYSGIWASQNTLGKKYALHIREIQATPNKSCMRTFPSAPPWPGPKSKRVHTGPAHAKCFKPKEHIAKHFRSPIPHRKNFAQRAVERGPS